MKVTTIYYLVNGFLVHFKATSEKYTDFVAGDKFIIFGKSKKPEIIESEERAKRINDSFVNDFRKVFE